MVQQLCFSSEIVNIQVLANQIMHPWLSILIPTYNGERFLPFALDSILFQNDLNIECIVVDDGSVDDTLSILESYENKLTIKIFQRERKGNWVANTNYALSFARGEYLSFLHQDDIWLKNRLTIIRQMIDQFPDVDFFLHASNYIDQNGRFLGSWRCPLPNFPEIIKPDLMMERLLIQNFISIPAPVFKREVALKVGGLDETLWYTADWDFWLKIASNSQALYCPQPLTGFRIQPASQTVIRSSYLEDFKNQLDKVLQDHLSFLITSDSMQARLFSIAAFSNKVNTTLAGMFHGKKIDLADLLLSFLLLGPIGWFRYLRDSRILERLTARLKAKLMSHNR